MVSIIGVFNTCDLITGRSTQAIAKIVQAYSVRMIACSAPEEVHARRKGNTACRYGFMEHSPQSPPAMPP